MIRSKTWLKTGLAMLAGVLLTLAVQGLGGRWTRPAEAARLDDLARSGMSQLIHSLPWVGNSRIRGITGLGDGRTFIVYTDKDIMFYQFFSGPISSPSSAR